MANIAALIVAAGRGTRAATGLLPKQYVAINGEALLAHTLKPFLAHAAITQVMVVRHAEDAALYAEALATVSGSTKLLPAAIGGETRQASVHAGLKALSARAPDVVLIHDAARPFITGPMLDRLVQTLAQKPAALLASRVTDTIKESDAQGLVSATVPRERLWRAETPQGFAFPAIFEAHTRAVASGRFDFTDDAGLAEWAGLPVALVDSGGGNSKITHPEDLTVAEVRLGGARSIAPDIRVGQGFDVHKFKDGSFVWLCGVKIKHTHGVDAHSDGDVGLHALTDALLGTIADGDIGLHFKNTDPRWKDASSDRFLADALRRVTEAGGQISNVDLTILCEAPKITPHRDAMRTRIGDILGLAVNRISIKATTTETMGFTGRREGLAAMATATVIFT